VAGITPAFDGTHRALQKHSFFAGKGVDRSGALGPLIQPASAVEAGDQRLVTRIDGAVVQEGSTRDWIRGAGAILAYLSRITALHAGDVVMMGTPSGVGAGRTPPRWLKAGERVEVQAGSMPALSVDVIDAV
jgi:2-keto-4-pentenoate hydratase/2-oxohepta-3-ene-1,7-dioic acid hydratase in catechol pathway